MSVGSSYIISGVNTLFQMAARLIKRYRVWLLLKDTTSLLNATQLETHHPTSLGQRISVHWCFTKERVMILLVLIETLLAITHVQHGMESVKKRMQLLQLQCTVSYSFLTMLDS